MVNEAATRRIAGEPSFLDLPTFLQAAVQKNAEGTLTVRQGDAVKKLFLHGPTLSLLAVTRRDSPGAWRHMSRGHPRLGQILVEKGVIDEPTLDGALKRKGPGVHVGEVLMQEGRLSQADLVGALEEQAMEEVYELFTWRDVALEFHPGRPSRAGWTVPRPVMEIIFEAMRRADTRSWVRRIIPSRALVPVRVPGRSILVESDLPARLLYEASESIDGKRSVLEILQAGHYPESTMEHLLADLVERGALRLRGLETPLEAPDAPGVLVAGPHRGYGTSLGAWLRAAGFHVEVVVTTQEARDRPGVTRSNLVVLDLEKRGEDWTEWRKLAHSLHAGLLILCDQDTPAREARGQDLLIKPITQEALIRRVSRLLKP